jgi:hypothetical protein
VRICTGDGVVYIGETTGGICQLYKSFTIDYWKAYNHSLSYMAYVSQGNILVTIGVTLDNSTSMTNIVSA